MSNAVRLQIVGETYHVNTKAVDGVFAFPDYHHREMFLRFLRTEIEKSGWECLGYVIVGTHYHLVIRLTKPTLSSGMQRLNSRYARWYNQHHRRRGALWQRRFFDVVVESEEHLLEIQRYLAYNAPRANLAERPEDWPYSNYGSLVGDKPPDRFVLEDEILDLFSPDRDRARRELRLFVEERDPRERRRVSLPGLKRSG